MGWNRYCRQGPCLALVWLALVACGGATSSTNSTPTSSATGTPAVAGLIALGHSGLTGENSNPSQPGVEAKPNSWATGTAPSVHSIYQRMTAIRPDTHGRVANTAAGGASAAELEAQASEALSSVPAPALAIIQTIDDDIRCDGSDAAHVKDFGQAVTAALRVISTGSPRTQILVINQPGLPALELAGMRHAIATNPAVRSIYTGPGPCGLVNAAGRPIAAHVAALTAIIKAYENEQARACARFPTCQTDKGGLRSFKRDPSLVSSDHNHLNLRGQAELAAAVWPYARAALAKVHAG